jgi:hypothetical protein
VDNGENQPSSFNDEAWKSAAHLGKEPPLFVLSSVLIRGRKERFMWVSLSLLFSRFF